MNERTGLNRLAIFIYLTPILGLLPSAWTLYQNRADKHQIAAARLAIVMGMFWLAAYSGLNFTADTLESTSESAFRLLFVNSLMTSGYFLTSLGLMIRLSGGKSVRLPGLSQVADRFTNPIRHHR
jgi:hypothetical protein